MCVVVVWSFWGVPGFFLRLLVSSSSCCWCVGVLVGSSCLFRGGWTGWLGSRGFPLEFFQDEKGYHCDPVLGGPPSLPCLFTSNKVNYKTSPAMPFHHCTGYVPFILCPFSFSVGMDWHYSSSLSWMLADDLSLLNFADDAGIWC